MKDRLEKHTQTEVLVIFGEKHISACIVAMKSLNLILHCLFCFCCTDVLPVQVSMVKSSVHLLKFTGTFSKWPWKQTTLQHPEPSRGTGRRPWWPPLSLLHAAPLSCTQIRQGQSKWEMSLAHLTTFYGTVWWCFLLGSKAHVETGQVAIGEGEEDHEDDVPGIVVKQYREVVTWLDVTQNEQRDEDDPQTGQDRKQNAVFTGLRRERNQLLME